MTYFKNKGFTPLENSTRRGTGGKYKFRPFSKRMFRFRGRSFLTGFTLVEILVVVGIIGILASIIILSVKAVKQKAIDARATESLSQIEQAAILYRTTYGVWATDVWPGQMPDFVRKGFYSASGYNAEYYCPGCTYDWQDWCNGACGPWCTNSCVMIDIYNETLQPVRRRCIYCDPVCQENIYCTNF